jgi:hypothetical protein
MRSRSAGLLARAAALAAAPWGTAPALRAAGDAPALAHSGGCSRLAERAASHWWASTSAAAKHTHSERCGSDCGHDHGSPGQGRGVERGGPPNVASSGARGEDSAFAAQEATCWSCNDRHKRGSLLCQACDKIQPVDGSLTYFDLMGMCAGAAGAQGSGPSPEARAPPARRCCDEALSSQALPQPPTAAPAPPWLQRPPAAPV